MVQPEVAVVSAITESTTPDLGQVFSRTRFWLVLAGIAIVVVVILLISGGMATLTKASPLAPDSPAPTGAKALVQVLRANGVEVSVADGFKDALSKLDEKSTLLLFDPNAILEQGQVSELVGSTGRSVLLDPSFEALEALGGVAAGGAPATPATDGHCGLGELAGIRELRPVEHSYTVLDDDWVACFSDSEGRSLLVANPATGFFVYAGAESWSNENIVSGDEAALALRLLGANERLVWYLPDARDLLGPTTPTLTELTPDWVTPVVVLLLCCGLGAAIWRGRRFGPLVAEDLPVIVPARESVEGRARLYERSGDRNHALRVLRLGTIDELVAILGLGTPAQLGDVLAATAHVTGMPKAAVDSLLALEPATSDKRFVELARQLAALVDAARDQVAQRPRANTQTRQNETPGG